LTTSVTGKVCGELSMPVADTVTFALYVPGPRFANTCGFNDNDRAWGVVPDAGLNWRKLGDPVAAEALALKFTPGVELVICTFCVAGTVPPS